MTSPAPRKMHFGEAVSSKALHSRALASVGPGLLWLFVFFLLPLVLIGLSSFLSRGEFGTIERAWTIENYRRLAGFGLLGFDSVYPMILARSLTLGFGTAAACVVVGLPLAFFIARLGGVRRILALTLVVIPFWTNLLIRTYAWQILLGPESWITRLAAWLGLATEGQALYPGTGAVYLCMVCDFLPFLVLPLYASVEKMDWSLIEAAMDLGANRFNVFRHAVWPQIQPGVMAGFILVFLPATGQFVVPDLLGGARTVMLGNLIQHQFGPGLDWPFGSAIAMVSLLVVTASLGLFTGRAVEKEMEIS